MTKWSIMETFKGKITIRVTLVLTLVVFVQGDCGRPKEMPFAELSRKHVGTVTFPVGSSVTYHCHPGYVKIPGKSASLQCLPDSKWSETEELCRPRSCGNPGELLHGWVETNGTTVGSVAIFHCDTGYNMISRAYRKCLETGLWSNNVPICESVICAPPPNSPNAVNSRMEEDADFTYLSSVTYHCTVGVLDGEASIYCTHHGNWSGPAPECIDVSCPVPRVNNAVLVSGFGTHFTYGQVLTVRCLEGFVMNGSSVLQCGRGGAWLPEKPVCKHRASCPEPEVANGHIIFGNKETFQSGLETGYRVSTSVKFQCDPGFYVSGSDAIQCLPNRQWKPNKPNCVLKTSCPKPNIKNGYETDAKGKSLTSQKRAYRKMSMAYLTCNPGFILNGSEVIHCGAFFDWYPLIPSCIPELDAPSSAPSLVPGTAGGSSVLQGATVGEGGTTMHCPTSFLPVGKQLVTCTGGSTAGPEDTAKQASAEGLCDFVWKSMTEYWKRMNVEDKYIHLELQKLCLDIRNLHLQIEKANTTRITPSTKRCFSDFFPNIGFSGKK
ncbi:C4b-binding protein-like isoform X1 [Lissotriton helveticus]